MAVELRSTIPAWNRTTANGGNTTGFWTILRGHVSHTGVPVPGALANLPSRARLRSYENHNVQRNGSETVSLARSSADR